MSVEVGTLKEIGAQVGDVVELVAWGPVWNKNNDFARGKHYTVGEDSVDSGTGYFMIGDAHWRDKRWRIISRANQGPVREVTTVRKEIVPGLYGKVAVSGGREGEVGISISISKNSFVHMTADELSTTISTLQTIRDAMQANATA